MNKAKGVPAFAAHLLDFIGDIEAPRGYDTVYGNNQGKLKKPVTQMTIAEVQAAQAGWTKQFGSSATGRYQFMRATLKGLIAERGLDVSAKFDERMQDRLGFALLRRRGYDKFVAGTIGVTAFGKALAQEWASLPVLAETRGAHRTVARGQSYYAGDGLNKPLVSPERVEAALKVNLSGTVVAAPAPTKPKPPVPTPPKEDAKATGIFATIAAALAGALAFLQEWLPEILVGIAVAIAITLIILRVRKGSWIWQSTSIGAQSLESSPPLPQSSVPSSAQLSAARLALLSAASPEAQSPQPSEPKQPRKRSAKPSRKTRKRVTN
jgi:muramidase (phage lysozyme)